MLNFLTENITPLMPLIFAISIISQLLVKLIGLLFSLIFRPAIKLYPAGEIEIGFGSLGPNLTLFGTMQAVRGDLFVTRMEVSIERIAKDAVHLLEWRAFKPYIFGFEDDKNVKYELVAAFLLKKEQPFKYNIVFTDDTFLNEETQAAKQIRDNCQVFNNTENHAPVEQTRQEAFYQQPNVQAIVQAWQQKIYWHAGDYQLKLCIHTTKRMQPFAFRFHLAEIDAAALQANVRELVFFLCGEKVRYAKAYAAYQTD